MFYYVLLTLSDKLTMAKANKEDCNPADQINVAGKLQYFALTTECKE